MMVFYHMFLVFYITHALFYLHYSINILPAVL